MTVFARPGAAGALMSYESRYENFIGGQWVAPVGGPLLREPDAGDRPDVLRGAALRRGRHRQGARRRACGGAGVGQDRAQRAGGDPEQDRRPHRGRTPPRWRWPKSGTTANRSGRRWPPTSRWRPTISGISPAAIRAQEGSLSQIDEDTVAYHFHEPLGVVGQIIPWNFPILMGAWKLAPALAAGNAVVLKPAEQTPASILYLMSLIGDLLPPGVVNIVNGFGAEAGKPLASSDRIAKVAFTGETTTGRLIMQYASQNLIPVTLELGGKSPNIFFSDVMAANDDFQDKALEGFTMFALNQGEVCTCPSRSLIQADIYDEFLELAAIRTKAVRQGDPLDTETMLGSQASNDQLEKSVVLHRNRQGRGRQDHHRRRARRAGR